MKKLKLKYPFRRALKHAPFCERAFGSFLVLWGLLLQTEHFTDLPTGIFYGRLQVYAPGWAWGTLMLALGLARFAAYLFGSNRLRLILSKCTLALFWVIASIALYSQLWGATIPLSCFVAFMSQWCHGRLAKEIGLGL